MGAYIGKGQPAAPLFFMDFQRFGGMGAYIGKGPLAAPMKNRVQTGFLASEDFHRISQIFMDAGWPVGCSVG